jgi:hypothetical protein
MKSPATQIVPSGGGGDAIGSFAAAPQGILGGVTAVAAIWLFRLSAATIVIVSAVAVLVTLAACYRYSRATPPPGEGRPS